MPPIGTILSWLPLAVHIGYVIATSQGLPALMGQSAKSHGMGFQTFVIAWFSIIGAANLAFYILHARLPRLEARMLQVPGRSHWLSSPENKAILIGRLRGVVETALMGLNVFFLAVYQSIYQANAAEPVMRFSMPVLTVGFMICPLLLVVVVMVLVLRRLAVESRPPPGGEIP